MKRVVVGLVCLLAFWPIGGAYCQDAGVDSGGLLDLVFEVVTAPVDLLGHLSGHETAVYRSGRVYPGQCLPADCVPDKARNQILRYANSGNCIPAAAYGTSRDRRSYAYHQPRTPGNRYASRRVVRSGECPDCPSRRISSQDRPKPRARLSSTTALRKEQTNPKEIIVKVETKPQRESHREIVIKIEPGRSDQPAKEPVVKVFTNREQTSPEETAVKVETKSQPVPAKETVVRVEIKEQPAVQTPKAPPQPVSKPEKPRKKKKTRGFGGCSPYGVRYY